MPLPRFTRLPAERRDMILRVAREQFAAEGLERASYNQIIAAAGISKASAYQYFDGRDDLAGAVLAEALDRAKAALGPWEASPNAAAFWARLDADARRLIAHLASHPDDRAVLSQRVPLQSPEDAWLVAMITDGQRLGVIDRDTEDALLRTATAGVFQAIDAWVLARTPGQDVSSLNLHQAWKLLARLWHTPPSRQPKATANRARAHA